MDRTGPLATAYGALSISSRRKYRAAPPRGGSSSPLRPAYSQIASFSFFLDLLFVSHAQHSKYHSVGDGCMPHQTVSQSVYSYQQIWKYLEFLLQNDESVWFLEASRMLNTLLKATQLTNPERNTHLLCRAINWLHQQPLASAVTTHVKCLRSTMISIVM